MLKVKLRKGMKIVTVVVYNLVSIKLSYFKMANKNPRLKDVLNVRYFGILGLIVPTRFVKIVMLSMWMNQKDQFLLQTVKERCPKIGQVVSRVQSLIWSDLDSYCSDNLLTRVNDFSCCRNKAVEVWIYNVL